MLDVLIMLDTTGSMNPVAHETRQRVTQLTETLFKENDVRIGIISHGDYVDYPNIYTQLNFTNDLIKVQNFIKHNMPKTNGGDSDECYEYIYQLANEMDWRNDATKLLVQFSDANPHDKYYDANRFMRGNKFTVPDWKTELLKLREKCVTVYALQCLSGYYDNSYYKQIAEIFNTKMLKLKNFSDAVDSILLIALHASNKTSFNNYVEGLELNIGIAQLIDSLSGTTEYSSRIETESRELRSKAFSKIADGLVPVDSFRFQRLTVPESKDIKSFVESTGADFKIGKGFYELSKVEVVQENKEVILVDRYGTMFTGKQAREMIGVPIGKRGKVYKSSIPDGYKVFIQSTSNNRKLVANTEFLYEVK